MPISCCFFFANVQFGTKNLYYSQPQHCVMGSFSLFRGMKTQLSRFTTFFPPLVLFHTHFHTTRTICPSFPPRGRALKMLVFISKLHSVPLSEGKSPPRMRIFSPRPPMFGNARRTFAVYTRARLCSLFILMLSKRTAVSRLFLVSWWWKAPAALSRKPSPPFVAAILSALFTSRVVIQSLLKASTFATLAEGNGRAVMWLRPFTMKKSSVHLTV